MESMFYEIHIFKNVENKLYKKYHGNFYYTKQTYSACLHF